MSHAEDIVRLGAEHRASAHRILAELADVGDRNAELAREIAERFRQRTAQAAPTHSVEVAADEDEDPYYRPKSWLV